MAPSPATTTCRLFSSDDDVPSARRGRRCRSGDPQLLLSRLLSRRSSSSEQSHIWSELAVVQTSGGSADRGEPWRRRSRACPGDRCGFGMRESQAFFSQFRLVFAFLPSVIVAATCCCFCCWFSLSSFLFSSLLFWSPFFNSNYLQFCQLQFYYEYQLSEIEMVMWILLCISMTLCVCMYKACYHYLAICAT